MTSMLFITGALITSYHSTSTNVATGRSLRGSTTNFYFGDSVLPKAETQLDLGLTISNDLKWNKHVDKVCSKALKVFHMIRRNTSKLGWKAKLDLYKSMVVPIILYASPFIGFSKHVLSQIERGQNESLTGFLLISDHTSSVSVS